MSGWLFAVVASAGLVALLLFGERAWETHDPRAFVGMLFGLCLMLVSLLILP